MRRSVLLFVLLLTTAVAANAQKFALIDMEYILKNIPSYERANDQLNQATTKWQSEIENLSKEAQNMYKSYQADAKTLSEAQKIKREEDIVAKEKQASELKRAYFGPEGEAIKLREKLIKPIQDQIYEAVKQVAELKGYSAIVDRASANSIIYANPRIDISNEVLANLGFSN